MRMRRPANFPSGVGQDLALPRAGIKQRREPVKLRR